ncbi:hypothetical protein ACE1SV_34010 [Streptomyces sp. E-15]
MIGRGASVTVSAVFAAVQVTTEAACLAAAEAVYPPTRARAATTTEEAAAREARRVAIRMNGLLSRWIRRLVFRLRTVPVGRAAAVPEGTRAGGAPNASRKRS